MAQQRSTDEDAVRRNGDYGPIIDYLKSVAEVSILHTCSNVCMSEGSVCNHC